MPNQWFDSTVKPLAEGFGRSVDPTAVVSQYVTGKIRSRRIYGGARNTTQVFHVTGGQVRLFESWWQSQAGANFGTAEFLCPCHISDVIETHTVKVMDGTYTLAKAGQFDWRITLNLEFVSQTALSGDWWEYYPEAITGAGIIDQAVNEELPE